MSDTNGHVDKSGTRQQVANASNGRLLVVRQLCNTANTGTRVILACSVFIKGKPWQSESLLCINSGLNHT